MLTVGLSERNSRDLDAIIRPCKWEVTAVRSCVDARAAIRSNAPAIALFETGTVGCHWRTMWLTASAAAIPPLFILVSEAADDTLWAEALNVGVYDVLATPFRIEEVVRTLHGASMFSRRARDTRNGERPSCHYCQC